MDRRDDGDGAVVYRRERVVAAAVHLGDERAVAGQLLDVDAGAEAAAAGRDHDHAHEVVAAERLDRLREEVPSGAVERVDRRVVQQDFRDTLFHVGSD